MSHEFERGMRMLEKMFKLSQNKTNMKTEVVAGMTTFVTMAYILAVNPTILSTTGMNAGGIFTATVLAAIIGSLLMGILSNYPFALAPGMGLNAFFAFTVAVKFGWQYALVAVFVEGLIFILLTMVNLREAIFNSIPQNIKHAVSAGIGLFIAFIGLQGAGIVGDSPATLVTLGNIRAPQAVLACAGVIVIAVLTHYKVKGAILYGILATYGFGIIAQLTGWYVVDINAKMYSLIPSKIISLPPSLKEVIFFGNFAEGAQAIDWSVVFSLPFFGIVLAFLFVDLFDTLGTLMGVSSKVGYLDKDGRLPRIKNALFADAIATSAGAILGTSTTTTFVESAAGVAEGGRTGLTSVVTAIFFGLALFFAPVFLTVPGFATAPALIVVGYFMLDSIQKIDFSDITEAIPAFVTIVAMPLTYSISEGIAFGVISYVVINVFTAKFKKIHPVLAVLCLVFMLKFIF